MRPASGLLPRRHAPRTCVASREHLDRLAAGVAIPDVYATLPAVTGLDLAALVNTKVVDELEAMNGRLEALVADAGDGARGRLVRQLVEQNLDGRDDEPRDHEPRDDRAIENESANGDREPADPDGAAATKRCNQCGELKLVSDFGKHRCVCRACRNRAIRSSRQRRAASEAVPVVPFGGSTSPSLPEGDRDTRSATSLPTN